MKRVKSACIQQTLHFQLKEDLDHTEAVQAVKEEFELYKKQLERKHTKFKIVNEEAQADGSIMVQIIKQYNAHDCGSYLD